jgi:hypothetical protein
MARARSKKDLGVAELSSGPQEGGGAVEEPTGRLWFDAGSFGVPCGGEGVGQQPSAKLPRRHVVALLGEGSADGIHHRPSNAAPPFRPQAVPEQQLDQAMDADGLGAGAP